MNIRLLNIKNYFQPLNFKVTLKFFSTEAILSKRPKREPKETKDEIIKVIT